jgi:hypothetical protein
VPRGGTFKHNIVQAQREIVRKQLWMMSIVPRPLGDDVQPCSCSAERFKEMVVLVIGPEGACNKLRPEPRLRSTGNITARDGPRFNSMIYNTKASICLAAVKQSCFGLVKIWMGREARQTARNKPAFYLDFPWTCSWKSAESRREYATRTIFTYVRIEVKKLALATVSGLFHLYRTCAALQGWLR